jgi:hypothetical protein
LHGFFDKQDPLANKPNGLFNDWKVKAKLPELREKFTDQEIMYGLRIVLGLARGKNETYKWGPRGPGRPQVPGRRPATTCG